MSSLRRFVVGFAACASAMAPGLAMAQEPPILIEGVPRGLPWTAVRYDDLNLASPAGIARLYGRVHQAAESMCVDRRVLDLGRWMDGRQCMVFALNRAHISVNHAIARYQARNGRYYAAR